MIFYLTGPDTFRMGQKLSELKAKFLREVDPTGLGMTIVDGAALTPETLSPVFSAAPLFARRRCVIVKNTSKGKDAKLAEAIVALLQQHDKESGNLIIFVEDDESKGKNALHAWLLQHAYHQAFAVLQGRQLEKWIEDEFKKKNRLIEPAALQMLMDRTQGDSWALNRTMAKIDAYLEVALPVTRSVVEELVGDDREEELFPLIDAIVQGRVNVAAPMMTAYLGQGENAQSLVALLESQLRVLILLADNPRAMIPGVHPFVVKKLTPLARRLRPEQIRALYESLSVVDRELKSSTIDPATLLLSFVVSAATP